MTSVEASSIPSLHHPNLQPHLPNPSTYTAPAWRPTKGGPKHGIWTDFLPHQSNAQYPYRRARYPRAGAAQHPIAPSTTPSTPSPSPPPLSSLASYPPIAAPRALFATDCIPHFPLATRFSPPQDSIPGAQTDPGKRRAHPPRRARIHPEQEHRPPRLAAELPHAAQRVARHPWNRGGRVWRAAWRAGGWGFDGMGCRIRAWVGLPRRRCPLHRRPRCGIAYGGRDRPKQAQCGFSGCDNGFARRAHGGGCEEEISSRPFLGDEPYSPLLLAGEEVALEGGGFPHDVI